MVRLWLTYAVQDVTSECSSRDSRLQNTPALLCIMFELREELVHKGGTSQCHSNAARLQC
jgi:hypothetical protein